MAHRAKRAAHVMRLALIDAQRTLISLEHRLISLAQRRIERKERHTGKKYSLVCRENDLIARVPCFFLYSERSMPNSWALHMLLAEYRKKHGTQRVRTF
jgi:hypothetical protein